MLKMMGNRVQALLRWSEKYTKTDMVYLAHGGSYLFAGQLISMAAGFVLSVGFAHLVAKETFGTYQFILSLGGIVSAFSLTGINVAISRASALGSNEALRVGFLMRLRWNVVMVLIALAGAAYYFINANNTLATALLVVASLLPFLSAAEIYAPFLEGRKAFDRLTLYGAARNIIPTVLLLCAMYVSNNPVLIVLAFYLANTVTVLLLYRRTRAHYQTQSNDVPNIPLIHESKHLTLLNSVSFIADQLDKVLVFHYLGATQLAVYVFAQAPVKQMRGFTKIIRTLIFPKLVVTDIQTLKRTLPRKAILYLMALIACVGTYVVLAPFFYEYIFPQYVEAIGFSQVLAATLLFAPVALFRKTFLAHFKKRELYSTELFTSLFSITLLLILLPQFGIWGAVMSQLIATIADTLLVLFLFLKLRTD